MIYLLENNFPLNAAFDDEIIQEANSTYQLTFKFPTTDSKWTELKNEVLLVADDLHGEQYFSIFEVEKQHGYITVYANQVATLLNSYSINTISVDRANGFTVMNALVSALKRPSPFTFFSDINSKHTINLKNGSVMEALVKDKHSIVGQWGGDLVRDKYSIRLLERAGVENESLFAYKKNMKSYQESASTKELKTRIHFRRVIESHDENKKDQVFTATIDSPLIGKYKNIYEADMEVQDQDVVDQKTLEEYGKRYFRETLCDMVEESLEIDVIGQSDQPVNLFDTVSVFHERYNADLRKKITKYRFAPMRKKLVSIGFGKISQSFGSALGNLVEDKVNEQLDEKLSGRDKEYEAKVQKLVDNANAEYLKKATALEQEITDGIEQAKARSEVLKKEVTDSVNSKFADFNRSFNTQIDSQKERIQAISDLATDANRVAAEASKNGENAIKYALSVKGLADHNFTTVRNLSDKIDLLATKQELDPITDRLRLTESQIELQAGQITEKLSRTEVDRLIDGKGFQNAVQVQNLVKKSVDGFQQTISRVENKLVEFNDVVDTVKSHTQTIQRQNESISQVIQTADGLVSRVSNFLDDFNLVYDPTNFSKWKKKQPEANVIEVQASTKLLRITNLGHTNNVYRGFALPITTSSFTKDEKLSYRIEAWIDVLPDAPLGIELWNDNSVIASDRVTFTKTGTQIITGTMTVNKTTTKSREFPLEFWLLKNGTVAIGKVSLVRGDRPPTKFTDNTSTQDVATQTQVSQLAGSYAIKNLNSAGDIINGINIGADGNNRFVGKLTHITGETLIDKAVIKSAMVDKLKTGNFESGSVTTQILASNAVTADKLLVDSAMINKLVTNQAFIRELTSQKAFITQLNSIAVTAEKIQGGRLTSNTGSMVFDLDNSSLNMMKDTASIRRIYNGYPTQFMRYEASIENGHKHAKTIIGSNRNGTESWNSPSFAGIVIDNNANNSLDNIYQFGDHIHFKHSQGDDGWRFSNVSQIITPGVWNKNSEIWARSFVIPRETRGANDTPTKFINLVESVAALWKLWAHAKGQIGMTDAMKNVIQGSLDAWGYSRPHI
jgi:phage minor structural protein|nr:MAG TPA: Neck appendage protein [Bacteriophage sp.]